MHRAWLSSVVLGLFVALSATPALAATLTVNTTTDETTPGDHLCSLREAIQAVDSPGSANGDCAPAAFGDNTIVLGAHIYYLGLVGTGELTVSGTVTHLTLTGAGESSTKIDATALGDRVLQIDSGANVTISDLTITGGSAPAGSQVALTGQAGGDGGAILNQGTLGITDAAVTNSRAGDGGSGGPGGVGIMVVPGFAGGQGGSGGAIYNAGSLALTGATIAGDHAGDGGRGGDGPDAALGFSNGGAGGSGGAGGDGGGVSNAGTQTVIASTFSADGAGSGGAGGNGGAGLSSSDPGGNGGNGGAAAGGGAISSTAGAFSVLNSTFASNSAGDGGGGGSAGAGIAHGGNGGAGGSGGAVGVTSPAGATIRNVTMAADDAGTGAAGGSGTGTGTDGSAGGAGSGGGIFAQAATLQNSLLASDGGGNCSGAVADAGHNLSFAGSGCRSTFLTADPNLGPLQDNGGPTPTISLGTGSAAIDKVPVAGAGCPAVDQRGVGRPSGPACDIGAYELAPPAASTGTAQLSGTAAAIVFARITPNAGDAGVSFQYGKSKRYGSQTRVQPLSGVSSTIASAKLTGLKPNTTYHYRVVATSMDGTSAGVDRSFSTSAVPVIAALRLASPAFRATGNGGTLVSYTDTNASRTTLTVLRPVSGARQGKRCVRRTPHGAHARRCVRYVEVGSLSRRDVAGRNHFRFSGRIGGRALTPGTYRLAVTPRSGRFTGKPDIVGFTIIR